MATIFNLCAFLGGVTCLGLGIYLKRSFLRNNIYALEGYSYALLFLGAAYVVLVFPGWILFDPCIVQADFILSDLLFLSSALFFGTTTLSFYEIASSIRKIAFLIVPLCAFLYALLSVIFFSPAVPLRTDGLVYYWKSGMPGIQGAARALFCLVSFLVALFFLQKVIKTKRASSKKAFLLGLSGILVFIGGFIYWFLPFFYFTPQLLAVSGIIGFLGLVVGGIATFLRLFLKDEEIN